MLYAALSIAVIALLVAGIAVYIALETLDRSPNRRLMKMEHHIADAYIALEDFRTELLTVQKQWKKLNARVAMQIAREKGKENGIDPEMPDPQKSPAEWKRQMMLRYPKGALSAGGMDDDG